MVYFPSYDKHTPPCQFHNIWNREPLYKNRVFGLNLVHTGTYQYVPVCTAINEISKYIPVCTEYVPKQSYEFWTLIEEYIQCWNTTACMLLIHSIVSYSHLTQKNILRNISVLMVHTSIHQYILGSYLYIPVHWHVISIVKGALLSWFFTTIYLSHTPCITCYSPKWNKRLLSYV